MWKLKANVNPPRRKTYVRKDLKSDSHLPKKMTLFVSLKAFKDDKKCFLFHVKKSFCSQDIQVFIMTF